ncbi:MAG: 5'/3'-nucleotidase SurE [Verrucomicrobiales bacterium]|nr:5'/3'-nucleotidase SurE [Verrucomicrobiales bacterium]
MLALITNDDGIDAEGLAALEQLASHLFDEVWTVAPAQQASEIGHRVTTKGAIRVEEQGYNRYAIHGTPADCTRLALSRILPAKPDWILSGINHGGNLGRHDFVISGTVAAVREAAFAGIPGVAVSHFIRRGLPLDWDAASSRALSALELVMGEQAETGEFWCINLPHPENEETKPQVVFCEQEHKPLIVEYSEVEPGHWQYSGDYHSRPRTPGSDVDVCFRGDIAVSRVSV